MLVYIIMDICTIIRYYLKSLTFNVLNISNISHHPTYNKHLFRDYLMAWCIRKQIRYDK